MSRKILTVLLLISYVGLMRWTLCAAEEEPHSAGNLDHTDEEVYRTINDTNQDQGNVEAFTAPSDANVVQQTTPEASVPDRTEGELQENGDEVLSDAKKTNKVPDSVSTAESVAESEEGKEDDKEKEKKTRAVTYVPELPPSIGSSGQLHNGSWFLMFYASWCEHSQAAIPEFVQVFQYLVDNNITGVFLGKIDVTKHGEVAKQFQITSTPTFVFYYTGIRLDYDDLIKTENLKNFMLHIITAEVPRVNTTNQLTELQKNHSVLFLMVHDEEIDHDWHSMFMKMTREKVLKGKFAYTTDPSVVEAYPVTSLPCVMVLKDGQAHFFREALTAYALARWIQTERYPDFPTVNMTTLRPYVSPTMSRRLAMLVVNEDPSRRRIAQKKAIEVVKKLAQARKKQRKYQYMLLEGVEVAEKILNRPVPSLPVFLVYEPFTGFHYLFEDDGITEKNVLTFLEKVSSGKIEPQGGTTLTDRIVYFGRLVYATAKTMTTHRPILSMATAFCVTGAVCFYITIFCQGRSKSSLNKNKQKMLARKAALAKKRREKEAEAEARKQERTASETVRRRDNVKHKKKDIDKDVSETGRQREGEEDEEMDESGSATASEGEFDSQAELSDDVEGQDEQSKKDD